MSPPTLESRGRTDVIRALSAHCIEYQSNFHSIQPAAAVYLRRLGCQDWLPRCPTQILAIHLFGHSLRLGLTLPREIFHTGATRKPCAKSACL